MGLKTEYKLYRKKISKEDYFNTWAAKQLKLLTQELQDQIYNKYLMKCEVFQRDNFECQNSECKFSTPLTLHHVKWQKNGGKNSARNGVTLCNTCHTGYHKAKREIKFSNSKNLPSHIRGHTIKLDKSNVINWKKVKKEMRTLRKGLKEQCGIKLTSEQICMLMKWLEILVDD